MVDPVAADARAYTRVDERAGADTHAVNMKPANGAEIEPRNSVGVEATNTVEVDALNAIEIQAANAAEVDGECGRGPMAVAAPSGWSCIDGGVWMGIWV
jgi:hypothetical protein